MDLKILRLKGNAIHPYLDDLAELRINVFKEYPYLYEGNKDYEKDYLRTYTDSEESALIVVLDKDKVVGASTAIPLQFETEECRRPFVNAGMDVSTLFYFGESVLKKQYRGQGVYRHFFAGREQVAKEYGATRCTFCAVERPADDPKRPLDYVPLDFIWCHFGYEKNPNLRCYYEWKEIGEQNKSSNPMVFWLKKL